MARRTRGSGSWLALFAFIAVMLLGLALLLSFILGRLNINSNIVWILERVALAIAVIIPLVLSYREARRLGTAWFVLWIIAVILVIVFYVLNFSVIWW